MYDIPDAPPTVRRGTRDIRNTLYQVVTHAHRVDNPAVVLGCSSKLAGQQLILHSRLALQDRRPWGSTNPPIKYGTIYGHFRRHPGHPLLPGNSRIGMPVPKPGPEDEANELPGEYPVGHPTRDDPFPSQIPLVYRQPPSTINQTAGHGGGSSNSSRSSSKSSSKSSSRNMNLRGGGNPGPHDTLAAKMHRLRVSGQPQPPSQSRERATPSRPQAAATSTQPRSTSSNRYKASSSAAAPLSSSSRAPAPRRSAYAPVSVMASYARIPSPKKEAVGSIGNIVAKLDKTAKARFDKAFDEWKATWFSGENGASSNSITRTQCPEFAALVALGPKYTPFVVYQLTKPGNFMACQLYNALERDTKYKVDPGDIANFKVLQRQANLIDPEEQSALIIDLNHERTLKFDRLATAWAEQQREHIGANNSSAYTVDCDAYWELVDLGPSIIANAMIEYAAAQDGWWHELLHEIVHGERGGGTFFKPQLYEAWKDWFENKDYDQAPKGEFWPDQKWPGPIPGN
ncbi:hypothetical protein VP1G_08083 [Cytospora mali]|uniref:Uncharacterized protein n=1 Tax=Cytospora mali TaxID=578113 RepID=A0A194VAQ2_CYTMA|nr:hypothetical protein VP1G_08083 [Valsa mali var. pyri (nom. inval.)]